VVAIGASAGGVEAFRRLLKSLPPDTGMAFVLIQHLDPTQPSRLTQSLSTATEMPVVEIGEGTRLAPDTVFVVPPAMDVSLQRATFHTSAVPDARSRRLSIDLLFATLAAEFGRKTIGVVLSGAGADGVEGLRAIQSAGGITFAQDAESARVASMPTSAVAAGVVDHALPPEAIAEELARLTTDPYLARTPPAVIEGAEPSVAFRKILARVLEETGVDLAEYKPGTIDRRLMRRMALRRTSSMEEYLSFLDSDRKEAKALLEDVLVHVTHYFRDPEIYEALRLRVFPAILAQRPAGTPIRVWVAGCSTGEEVYSIAIALVEYLAEVGRDVPIQIFGSDLSEAAIERARAGTFADSLLRDVNPERIDRFFARTGGGHRVQKLIRDLCVFAKHDVARDPPFSKIDLVTCRNTLIYFGSALQQRVLRNFHYALAPGGFLVLGGSESVTGVSNLFTAFDKENKVFRRMAAPAHMAMLPRQSVTKRAPVELLPRRSFDVLLQRQVDALVARYSPPGVVVNARGEVLLFRGRSVPYIEPPTGQPTTNIFRMARGGVAAELRAALKQAGETMVTARREGLTMRSDSGVKTFDLEIAPIPGHLLDAQEPCFLVLFMEMVPTAPARERQARGRLRPTERERLEHELASTRIHLQSLSDEQQRTADELNATNDELVSTNEELQSTNEEIESAKEELQSTNEELTTLNDELRNRNDELVQLNDDLVNLVGSVDIPIVILSRDRRIRRFTPRAQRLMNLIPADVGRPIDDIRLNLTAVEVDRAITQALESMTAVEADVQDRDGRWCRLQIRPYRTSDNRIDGVVLSLLDIDDMKHAIQSAERTSAYTSAIVEAVPIPLLVLDAKLEVLTANRAFHRAFEWNGHDTIGRQFEDVAGGAWNVPELIARIRGVFVGDRVEGFVVEHDFAALGPRVMELHAEPIDWQDTTRCLLVAIHDITARTFAERERASLLERAESARALAEEAKRDAVEAQQEAERANRTKDVFLATLSHELRTPLTSILLNTERLRDPDGMTPDGVARTGYLIERAARTQSRLIDDLLDVSRVITGKLHLKQEPIDLSKLVLSAAEPMREAAERRGLRFETLVTPAIGTVVGDAVRLEQVVWNLATNAIKFTPEGGVVRLELTARDEVAVLRVSDSGKGIDAHNLEDVFGFFSQEDGATNRRHGGLGLGLAIVRHLVEAHGGNVKAASEGLGRGASFTVELPLSSHRVPTSRAERQRAGDDLSGLDVLVVEDDEATRELVAEILARKGATVRSAGSAAEGLSAVRDHAPEVILCDIAMPDRDGYDFVAALRAMTNDSSSTVPVVAVTALASEAERDRILAAGFDEHIPKPIDTRRLAAVVNQLARGAQS
jgi:two-component system, chemotaxis family, CheB/CheR fusion protein